MVVHLEVLIVHDPTSFQISYKSGINKGNLPTEKKSSFVRITLFLSFPSR